MAQDPNDFIGRLAEDQDDGLADAVARAGAANAAATQPDNTTADDNLIVVQGSKLLDQRVRISSMSTVAAQDEVYGPADPANILFPLRQTNGLMFPYTPTVSISQDTTYSTADLEHSIYDILSYSKSSSASINVQGKFTVQNQREGEYLLAVIHFLRTVSKTYFGKSDANVFRDVADQTEDATVRKLREDGKAGLPPPVLIFSGYGEMMFSNVRVVVKNYSFSLDENADMVPINLRNGGLVYLPPVLSLSIGLGVQTNPDDLREDFSLAEFRTGDSLLSRKGWF